MILISIHVILVIPVILFSNLQPDDDCGMYFDDGSDPFREVVDSATVLRVGSLVNSSPSSTKHFNAFQIFLALSLLHCLTLKTLWTHSWSRVACFKVERMCYLWSTHESHPIPSSTFCTIFSLFSFKSQSLKNSVFLNNDQVSKPNKLETVNKLQLKEVEKLVKDDRVQSIQFLKSSLLLMTSFYRCLPFTLFW